MAAPSWVQLRDAVVRLDWLDRIGREWLALHPLIRELKAAPGKDRR